MNDEELAALEAAAEKATRGPWRPWFNFHGDPFVMVEDRDEREDGGAFIATIDTSPSDYGKGNAKFIAAADPLTIAALCRELRDTRAKLAEYRTAVVDLNAELDGVDGR